MKLFIFVVTLIALMQLVSAADQLRIKSKYFKYLLESNYYSILFYSITFNTQNMINPLNKTGSLKRAKKSGKSAKSDTKCSKQENKLAIPDTNTLKQLTDDYCTDPNNYNTIYG